MDAFDLSGMILAGILLGIIGYKICVAVGELLFDGIDIEE